MHVRWYWTSGALCGARGDPYGTEIDGRPRVRTRNTRSIARRFDRITRESQSNRERRCCGERTISRRCGSNHWRPETHGDKTRAPAAATNRCFSLPGAVVSPHSRFSHQLQTRRPELQEKPSNPCPGERTRSISGAIESSRPHGMRRQLRTSEPDGHRRVQQHIARYEQVAWPSARSRPHRGFRACSASW